MAFGAEHAKIVRRLIADDRWVRSSYRAAKVTLCR